eukprot:CAMPEP_0175429526 /NCGR_PEP_ID=MMETSP0095-20121207/51402_1 /TAXON_ID=311494 /ORGANISM="Alexandrium monilatum, Strain CCMP3105" /LENGTH=451 /DNA_ID=CAMNT_0016728975 /DNA_START=16 /DNA_END=1371 /DNA_ORIENTATION=-
MKDGSYEEEHYARSRSGLSGRTGGRTTRYLKGTSAHKPSNVDGQGVMALFRHPLCFLLLCLPCGIYTHFAGWNDVWTFWLNFFAMVPLAKILGDVTEELAAGLRNELLAGLLNATFGNAVEMVITVQTLRQGLFEVVKATLMGSVLSNVLLVLGMSFFFGGIVNARTTSASAHLAKGLVRAHSDESNIVEAEYSAFVAEKVQYFQALGALVNTSMLLLSCLSFSLVTVFHVITRVDTGTSYAMETMLPVSRLCSLIIISAYVAYIVFQLGTHREVLSACEESEGAEEAEEPRLSVPTATVALFMMTIITAFSSEILVEAIEGVTREAHIGEHFIGIILLPIIGNACEHAAAVRFAMQDKPGLSIGIAVGSSTQIALFVVPFSVLTGWAIEKDMDLNFGALNTTVMTLSVVVVLSMVVDGMSNWLQGYLLCAAYAVIAVLYWYLPNELPEVE